MFDRPPAEWAIRSTAITIGASLAASWFGGGAQTPSMALWHTTTPFSITLLQCETCADLPDDLQ
jgi:hypothetical protein